MSKKMLKRSLALGALMAFVITGSAMAADYNEETLYSQPVETAYDNIYVTKDVWSGEGINIDVTAKNNINVGVDADYNVSISTTESGTSSIKLVAGNIMTIDGPILVASEDSSITLTAKDIVAKASISSWGGENGTAKNAQIKLDATNSISVTDSVITDAENSLIELTAGENITVNGKVNAQKGTVNVISTGDVTINGSVSAGQAWVDDDSAITPTTNIDGKNIYINAQGGYGAVAWSGYYATDAVYNINLGSENTESVNINNASYGLFVYGNGTQVNVNANKLNITDSEIGMWVANRSVSTGDNLDGGDRADDAKVIIDADTDVNITNVEIGIVSQSQGTVKISGNLKIDAETAIDTRGEATTWINKDNDTTKVVEIVGDIVFDDSGDGRKVDSDVVINLANDKSYFTGNISNIAINADANKVTGMNIGLSNGATWNLSEASIVNNATFGADSNLVLKGEGTQFTKDGDFALNGVGDADVLTIEKDALITVEGMDKVTYNVATGFETITSDEYWTVVNDNALMKAEWDKADNNDLKLVVSAKDASDLTNSGTTSESTSELIASITTAISEGKVDPNNSAQQAAVDFIQNVLKNNPTPEGIKQATDNAAKMAEAGGNSATAASIVKNVTGVTNDRLSFNCGHSAPHKGGHGVGLFEEGSGADIWVEYVHGKDEVEDMPSTAGASSYEGQYNGIVMGVDFKKVGKFQSGIAFNYGEGDTNSVGSAVRTHSDYDFWGVGYYGNIHNDDSNVIFDINYAQTDSDVTQNNSTTVFEANPETTTWSAGVKLEKLYQNENVQIVPYTGLRYMSIDSDDYATKDGAFMYSMDRQDIWLLPLGVSIRQEIANDNGWTVSPRVDLSYIWAFGDTNSNMEVKSPFAGVSQLGYDVMDDGSFLGLVGIEAHKGQWGYGVAYSYQKGDHSESKKWYVDVNYSF